jgi:WD40 repeat protein
LAVLPDGRLASARYDRTVRLWDPRAGVVRTIITQGQPVRALAVLPDGRLASADKDGMVRLWDPRTGDVHTIVSHEDSVNALAVLPDGRLASADKDGRVRLWDPRTGDVHTIVSHGAHGAYEPALAVLPDGRLALASRDATVRLWDPRTGDVHTIITHVMQVRELAVLPDGRLALAEEPLLGGFFDSDTGEVVVCDLTVSLWDPGTGDVQVGDPDGLPPFPKFDASRDWYVTRDDRTFEVGALTKPGWRLEYDTRLWVSCVAADFGRYRVAAGLNDGRVLIFAVEPWASQVVET